MDEVEKKEIRHTVISSNDEEINFYIMNLLVEDIALSEILINLYSHRGKRMTVYVLSNSSYYNAVNSITIYLSMFYSDIKMVMLTGIDSSNLNLLYCAKEIISYHNIMMTINSKSYNLNVKNTPNDIEQDMYELEKDYPLQRYIINKYIPDDYLIAINNDNRVLIGVDKLLEIGLITEYKGSRNE